MPIHNIWSLTKAKNRYTKYMEEKNGFITNTLKLISICILLNK